MCRHIYNWNIVPCDVKQPISLTHSSRGGEKCAPEGPHLWETSSDRLHRTTNRMHECDLEGCGKKWCCFLFHSEVKSLTLFYVFLDLIILAHFHAISIYFYVVWSLCPTSVFLSFLVPRWPSVLGRWVIYLYRSVQITVAFHLYGVGSNPALGNLLKLIGWFDQYWYVRELSLTRRRSVVSSTSKTDTSRYSWNIAEAT